MTLDIYRQLNSGPIICDIINLLDFSRISCDTILKDYLKDVLRLRYEFEKDKNNEFEMKEK